MKIFSAKQNYDIKNKKLLIIITTLKKRYIYIKGIIEIIIYTNHKNLLLFTTMKELNRR